MGLVLACLCGFAAGGVPPDPETAGTNGYVGNQACARCHASIYESYSRTAMAHASGLAIDNLLTADFVHRKSRVHYRVYGEDGRVWLSFERPGDPLVRGQRELLYYIGSGRRGLTYLFAVDGFVFESPVNWYGEKRLWDMTPAYQNATQIPMNLPAYTGCLHCHVSDMQLPLKGSENLYAMPLFAQAGVACERCHGPGSAHVKGGPIVNPARLTAERRDAVCMQCHLEAKAAIERPGRHVYEYRPGDSLSDYIRYFVLADAAGLGAVSQIEALTESTCKKKSGDTMSCTSCHDLHSEPTSAERVPFYRGKCLACHGAALGEKHHRDKPDCTACHMPAAQSSDVAHYQVTDHRIRRRSTVAAPWLEREATASKPRLVPFPPSGAADLRDLALAWKLLADRGLSSARSEAEHLLRKAVVQFPYDPALLSALAHIEQQRGNVESARELFQRALAQDPDAVDAAANLGVLEARSGHLASAVQLWQEALVHAPYSSSIGMNLAHFFCFSGQFEKARSQALRLLEFDPDLPAARTLLQRLSRTPPSCSP